MSLWGALLYDLSWGEPPAWCHPVVWMGKYLGLVGKFLTERTPWIAFLGGSAFWLLGAGSLWWLTCLLCQWLEGLPVLLRLGVGVLLLKPLFSLRLLRDEVRGVEDALSIGLEAGRERLSRIVSRDTSRLAPAEVRESAIESLAENFNDSFVAPLFWYLLLGLPGVVVYRFANTADAMWGYRGRWEWAGKWAAVADDVLGWVPARIAAGLILVASKTRGRLWLRLPGEARLTPSPNSGWPMAAMALALGVRLAKPGAYSLCAVFPHPEQRHTGEAVAVIMAGAVAWCLLAGALGIFFHGVGYV